MNKKQIEELVRSVKKKEKYQYVHVSQSEVTGRLPDFEVEYELDISPEIEDVKPRQGMRPDFLYDGDDPSQDGIHMIWPELLDADGDVIRDKRIEPDKKGRAFMWILSPEARESEHKKRIKVGTKGYWVIGRNKLANVKVTKVIGLHQENNNGE